MEKEDWKQTDSDAWKHWKDAGDKIVWIPIANIVPSKWREGIRDQEKYEQTKNNIATNGLNNELKVIPVKDGKFMPYIGDHRRQMLKELEWPRIPCVVNDIPEEEALERCVSDNIARANYSGVELENLAWKFKLSPRYKNDGEIGKRAMGGITKSRVGQLLMAHDIRKSIESLWDEENSRVTLQNISPEVLLDTRPLHNDVDKVAVCKKVLKGEWLAGQVKKRCKVLDNWAGEPETEVLKDKVLYQNLSYDTIVREHLQRLQKASKTDRTRTVTIKNPNFIFTTYEMLNANLHISLSILDESSDVEGKKLANNYLKATLGLLLQNCARYKVIKRDKVDKVRTILGLHRPSYRNYDGGTVGGIEGWGGKKKKKEDEKV